MSVKHAQFSLLAILSAFDMFLVLERLFVRERESARLDRRGCARLCQRLFTPSLLGGRHMCNCGNSETSLDVVRLADLRQLLCTRYKFQVYDAIPVTHATHQLSFNSTLELS